LLSSNSSFVKAFYVVLTLANTAILIPRYPQIIDVIAPIINEIADYGTSLGPSATNHTTIPNITQNTAKILYS